MTKDIPENVVEVYNKSPYPFKTAKEGDVGHDLYANIADAPKSWIDRLLTEICGWPVMLILPFTQKAIPSGVRVDMPMSTWCQVEARSSTSRKRMMVLGGVIDSGYQGELYAVLGNFGLTPRLIRHGERYAQVIFHKAFRPRTVPVRFFRNASERGATGFGSTGQ